MKEGYSATQKKKRKKTTTTEQSSGNPQPLSSGEKPSAQKPTVDEPGNKPIPPVETAASAPASWPQKFEAGWKKGLYFENKEKTFSLKFRIKAQPQFYYQVNSNKKADTPDSVSFRMRRLELSWEGTGFTRNLDYKFQIDPTTSNLDELLQEAWLDYRFQNPLRVQFGQFKVPYNRQHITSSGRLQLVDRSLASDAFRFNGINSSTTSTTTCNVAGTPVLCPAGTANSTTVTTTTNNPRPFTYDLGLMLHGDAWDNKLEYYAGVFNNAGFNRVDTNADFLYLGRLVWNPIGQYGYQEADVNYSEHPAITVAASGGYMKQQITLTQYAQAGFELGAKYRGFSFQGEGYYRNNNPRFKKDYNDAGYYAQAGYLFKKRYEVAGRVSQVFLGGQGSNNTFGALPNNKSEFTGGFNYYIFQHDLKLQADYSYLTTQTEKSYGTTGDHRLRVQMQAWF